MTEGRISRLRWYARRAGQRPSRFADARGKLLRTSGKNEIWCRCASGPHRYPGFAARAHLDALSVEVRYAGVDILADPGICCYLGGRGWRPYLLPTIAHDTAAPDGQIRSSEGGPDTWVRHAHTREIELLDDGDIARWTAEHDGNATLEPSALHRRSVLLDRASRSIDIIDQIDGGGHNIRLAFHFGPHVQAELEESCAVLDWPAASTPGAARLELPPGLQWSLHRGEADPVSGWYPCDPGRPVPALTLLGYGRRLPGIPVITRLEFLEVGESGKSALSWQAISWTTSAALSGKAPELQAEAR